MTEMRSGLFNLSSKDLAVLFTVLTTLVGAVLWIDSRFAADAAREQERFEVIAENLSQIKTEQVVQRLQLDSLYAGMTDRWTASDMVTWAKHLELANPDLNVPTPVHE